MHTTEQLNTALAGRYVIERRIGEGGMAVVYLARDLRHNRQVALKVLNPELGAVLGSERFMAEIEVTANLHHPNLLPLFDSGEAGGLLFYAMPFVEGETLRARLTRERQLGVDEAVRIATAVAQALDYAHRHQVIHRDLKPENILLHEGQPLVMDFGIALAVSKAGGARITQTGLSLGTPQYMSPEQATGDHRLDGRSDIYSLGAVLYEMLTGDPPHTGSTVQAVIAKVITEQPGSVRTLRPTVPEPVEAVVHTALAKVPADRFATAAEFAAALAGGRSVTMPASGSRSGTRVASGAALAARSRGARMREAAAWGIAVAATVAAVWLATRPSPVEPLRRFTVEMPDSVVATGAPNLYSLGISADGQWLAVVGNRRPRSYIYVRRLSETEAREVPGTEGATRPRFSPDATWLLFINDRRELMVVPVTGGTPRKLADSVGTATWANDGTIYFGNASRSLWKVEAAGGAPERVATMDSSMGALLSSVEVLPDSRHAYVSIRRNPEAPTVGERTIGATIGIVDLATGSITDTKLAAAVAQYASPGLLVFPNDAGALVAVHVDRQLRPVAERPAVVAEGVATMGATAAVLDYAVSPEGTIAYRGVRAAQQPPTAITLVARDQSRRVLRNDGRHYDQPVASPDGKRAVVRVGANSFDTGDLWVLDFASGAFTPLTKGVGSYRAAWSRDGTRVFYVTGTSVTSAIHARPWDGSGADSVIRNEPGIAEFAEGPRGGWSVLRTFGARDILLVPTDSIATATPRPLITGPANETNPAISPDGRLLAYTSDVSGAREVYVTAIPGPGPRVPVSVGGGEYPRWSADGARLYYRAGNELQVATITTRPELAATERRAVPGGALPAEEDYNFAIMPDGGLLTTVGPAVRRNATPVVVMTGWRSLLKRPAAR